MARPGDTCLGPHKIPILCNHSLTRKIQDTDINHDSQNHSDLKHFSPFRHELRIYICGGGWDGENNVEKVITQRGHPLK